MGVQNPEIRHKEIDDKQTEEGEGINHNVVRELANRRVILPIEDIEIIRIPAKKIYIYNDALISILKELIKLNDLASKGVLASAKVKTESRICKIKNEEKEKRRIKTTVGFDYETYTKLKILSIVLNESMQDIITKALHEYFEKEDIKRILSTYFTSTNSNTSSSIDSK